MDKLVLKKSLFRELRLFVKEGLKTLAVLIDPDKFNEEQAKLFLDNLPDAVTHLFVGGSTDEYHKTNLVVQSLKAETGLPVILFPGDYSQISSEADAILFLSLISGRNPEYLIEQQVRSIRHLRNSDLEIIPTGYILIDGGRESAVQRISKTNPISREQVELIVETALAGQYLGKDLIYLEAGSGAKIPVPDVIISAVKAAVNVPVIVGGGIRSKEQLERAYQAGADMVVVGTAFERGGLYS